MSRYLNSHNKFGYEKQEKESTMKIYKYAFRYFLFFLITFFIYACAVLPERQPGDKYNQSSNESGEQEKSQHLPEEITVLTGKLLFVKGGCYEMGDTFKEGSHDEQPVHEVCIDDFYIGETEVTQKQWEEIMGNNPSTYKDCDGCPVEKVSWDDAQDFFLKLNERTGMNFRLPTEAEWEYVCRERGKKVRFGTGKDTIGSDEANFDAENYVETYSRAGVYRKKTVPVKSFSPNAIGVYDMSGNLWEWVQDTYYKKAYGEHSRKSPVYERPEESYRVVRGGGFRHSPDNARCTSRASISRDFRWRYIGLRIALTK